MALKLPATFDLERFFEKYEFTTRHLMSCSDAEAFSMKQLLSLADEETKNMWEGLHLGYTEMTGHVLLRKEIAKLHGINKDEALVVVPQEGIYIAMNCLVHYLKRKNGDMPFHAVAVYPAYQSLYENLKTHGCDISYWTCKLTSSGWSFDMEQLEGLVKENTRLLVVNFPHNPTGYLPTNDNWNKVIEFCRSRGIFLFSDEMYSLTNNDGSEVNKSACSLYTDSISLFGMSKTFAMPGLRLGWLCTQNKEIYDMMSNFKDYLTICMPSPSEILSIIGLRNHKVLLEHTMGIVCKNLKLLDDFFAKHEDLFEWHRPRAGTTAFVKIKGWLLKFGKGGATGLCDELIKKKELLILPAKMYDFTDEYFRLGFGRKSLGSCLKVFEEFIQENRPSTQ